MKDLEGSIKLVLVFLMLAAMIVVIFLLAPASLEKISF